MKITCYGGVGEIGGNKVLLETSKSRVLLDFGISYNQRGRFYEEYLAPRSQSQLHDYLQLGLLPRVDGIYRKDALGSVSAEENCGRSQPLWATDLLSYEEYKRREGKPYIDALLISHGHEDHYALAAFLGSVPTYCTEQTNILMATSGKIGVCQGYEGELTYLKRRSLGQYNGGYFPGAVRIVKGESEPRPLNTFQGSNEFTVGKQGEIEVQSVPVGHSVPGAVSWVLKAEGKSVVYTGDLRFHGRYKSNLKEEFADLKPDALLIEGTRIDEDIRDDEEQVRADLEEEINGTKGLVMVGFRWKDVERFETVREAAASCSREFIISPRLAFLLNKLGYDVEAMDNVRVFLERRKNMLYSPGDYTRDKYKIGYDTEWDRKKGYTDTTHLNEGITALEIRERPTKYMLQLTYWRFNNLLDIQPSSKAKYIRASTEPFNEEMELSEERLCNWLKHFGINYPSYKPLQIHASGHASGPELMELAAQTGPKALIPIHTENPATFKRELGKDIKVFIPELGEPIQI